MYKCKYFKISELVPPEIINLPEDYLWELFDENILRVIDNIRETLDRPITINNWKIGGSFSLRGFRPKNTKIGAPQSAHKLGKAIDFDVKGMTAEEVRKYLIKNYKLFPEIGRIEDDVNWVHIDTIKKPNQKKIYLFKP